MKTIRSLWSLARYRPGLYALNAGAWIVILVLELGAGYVAKLFFDWLTGEATAGWTLSGLLALVLAVGLVRMLSILAGALVDIRHRFTMQTLLRSNLLAAILDKPGAAALPGPTGEALNTMRDDVQVIEDTLSWVVDQLAFTAYAAIALVILIRIDLRTTLLAVLPLLSVVFASRVVAKHIRRFREASRAATERVTGAIGEAMDGVQAIQLFGSQAHIRDHIEELNRERLRTTVKDRLLSQSFHSFFWNAATLCTGLVLLAAADGLRSGGFTIGDFALFVTYVGVITEAIAATGDFMIHFKQAGVSLDRMRRLAGSAEAVVRHRPIDLRGDLTPVARKPLAASERLESLEIRGISTECAGSSENANGGFRLHDVDLEVRRGQFVVITGRIGSGKTTLLRAILGLIPDVGGDVRWNGRPVEDRARMLVPPRCAYTPQIPQLFSESLRDNILLGRNDDWQAIEEAVRTAVLERDLEELTDGLDTIVGSRGVKLSGGQRQRVAAARMFIRRPDLLVFDDLSSALDVDTEAKLWERVFAQEGATCLVVSHRRPALQRADRILVLKDGHVVGDGDLASLLASCSEMQDLWQTDATRCGRPSAATGAWA